MEITNYEYFLAIYPEFMVDIIDTTERVDLDAVAHAQWVDDREAEDEWNDNIDWVMHKPAHDEWED